LKNNYNPLNFHVEVFDNGVVDLTGFVSTEEEKEAFVKTVKAVPGVISVNAGISIIQPHI
jgi:osmotically-inducible protein OsmY